MVGRRAVAGVSRDDVDIFLTPTGAQTETE
ncbi:protein of unknown function [Paraburkholderia kururiensis]